MRSSHECNFAARLLDRLSGRSALTDAANGETIPPSQICEHIGGFAAGFLSNGLGPGDRLLIACGINPSSTLAYLGAMYAGIVPVLVDERMVATSGEYLYRKAKAKAAWTGDRVRWDWPEKNGLTHLRGTFEPERVALRPPAPAAENDLAVLMPTSGSTGAPRLVMVTHGNLIANTEAIIRSQRLGGGEKAMLIMPISYCFGASVMHTHLYSGGDVVFDSRFMFPDKVLQAINRCKCTTFAGVPTVYNILLRRSSFPAMKFPSLRRFLQAGGSLGGEQIQRVREIFPGTDFLVMYGQTEATARISCLPPEHLERKLGSAGISLDNVKLRIRSEGGGECRRGEAGEIEVSGPSICAGYLDDPEATRSKFVDGWLRTGDLGSVDEDGYLRIEGRTAEFIKIRGFRVSLAEVESKVAAVRGVAECAAAGVPHAEAGEALVVFVVKDNAERDGNQALMEDVRSALPTQWTCASVKIVSELPKTPNGKIARAQLQTMP